MPRTPAENERIRQLSMEKIRTVAMEMFIEKGYYATSISNLAQKASISKGLLYNYYGGKEELLSEMVNIRINEVVQIMEGAINLKEANEQLKYIIEGAIHNIQQNPKVHRFYLHLQTQPEADEMLIKYSKLLVEEHAKLFELQCKIFEVKGVREPRTRSLYFSSVLQGIMYMIATYPQQFSIEEVKQQILKEFCH